MEIKFKKSVIKALEQMDKPTKERIKKAIIGLTLSLLLVILSLCKDIRTVVFV